jgi:hypothetical protein
MAGMKKVAVTCSPTGFPSEAVSLTRTVFAALARRRGFGAEVDMHLLGRRGAAEGCGGGARRKGSHRRLKLRLRVHEEVGRADHLFAGLQALEDNDGIVELRTGLNGARLQIAVSVVDKAMARVPACKTAEAGITSCRPSGTEMRRSRTFPA